MNSKALRYAAIVGILVSGTPSVAGTIYDLTGTSLSPNDVSSFIIEFDDLNNDGKLSSTDDIKSFSGVTYIPANFTYLSVGLIPNTTFTNGGGPFWEFYTGSSSIHLVSPTFYSLDLSQVSAVPGPVVGAGLPGLIMAVGGLLAWRRRKQAAA